MSAQARTEPLFLSDDGSSFEWVEADTIDQAAERMLEMWGGKWEDYADQPPAESLQEVHFAKSGEQDEWGEDLYQRCQPGEPGAIRGFEIET